MKLCKKPQPTPFDAVRFTSSWLVSPAILFVARAIISLYCFAAIYAALGEDNAQSPSSARHEFAYFTTLTYWGLAFYFAFASMHTAIYWRSGVPFLASWPKVLQIAHAIYYSTITVFPFIVTIVFWSLIFSSFSDSFDVFSNISKHALNSVFALFEIIVPRTDPLPYLHITAIVIILGLYLALAYIVHATDHFYVYSFLDLQEHSSGVVAGYIIGILVGAVVVFLIVHFAILLRKWITETKLHMTGKFSSNAPSAGHEEMDDIQLKDATVAV